MIVVCKYYQLLMMSGKKFSREHKKLIRERMLVPEEEVERNNKIWAQTGRWYEIDKAATEDRNEQLEEKVARYREAKQIEQQGAQALAKTLAGLTGQTATPAIPKPPANPVLHRLRAKAKELGIKGAHLMSEETLNKKIAEKTK